MSEYHETSTELLHKLITEGITTDLLDEAKEHVGMSRLPKTVIDWDLVTYAPIKFVEQYKRNLPIKVGILPRKSDKCLDQSDLMSVSGKINRRWKLHHMSDVELWKEVRSHCRKVNQILVKEGLPKITVIKKTDDISSLYKEVRNTQNSVKELYTTFNPMPFLMIGSVLGCLRAIEEKTHGLSSDPKAQRFECYVKEWT